MLSVYYMPSLLLGAGVTAAEKTRSIALNNYIGSHLPISMTVREAGCLISLLPIPGLYSAFVKIKKKKNVLSFLADITLGQKSWEVTHGLNFSSPQHLAEYLSSEPKLHNDLVQWPGGTGVWGQASRQLSLAQLGALCENRAQNGVTAKPGLLTSK